MSDFSSKCREYLKNTGETVYQLSASSGLDRTSLQRMITGKRLPGMDFVRQFCDSIRINPSQRQELIELYKIEKIGKEIGELSVGIRMLKRNEEIANEEVAELLGCDFAVIQKMRDLIQAHPDWEAEQIASELVEVEFESIDC